VKICMITSSYPRYEGDFAGVFVKSLAEALVSIGHEVHVLAAYDPHVAPAADASYVKLHYFHYAVSRGTHLVGYARSLRSDARLVPLAVAFLPTYLLSGTVSLARLNLKENFDVVHAHWVIPCGPIGAMASLLLNVPMVLSLHGSDVYVSERNRLSAIAARISFRVARSIVACSSDLRARAIRIGAPQSKALTVPYGVDVRKFSRHIAGEQSVLAEFSQGRGPLVLSVGRLVGKKGFEYLVRAIPLILARTPSVRFAIVGDGDDRSRLVKLAHELNVEDRIAFLGAVPWTEVPRYLSACDVFVVPSILDSSGNIDGLPNTLLEAMAAGKAIVASNVAGIAQTISHGIDGLLVAEKSPAEIADAVTALLSSPDMARQLGESAREKVLNHFSWEGAASAYSRIYEDARRGPLCHLSRR